MEQGMLYSRVAINHKKLFRIHRDTNIKLTLENNMFLLTASKSGNSFTIYNDSNSSSIVGKVVSNFLGTEYTIHDSTKQVALVLYETNLFGLKGPRKMTVVLPSLLDSSIDNPVSDETIKDSSEILSKKFKENPDQVLVLHNKQPMWNDESESFVLNFEGRVTLASVKNFQIVSDLDLGSWV
jgi:hypothetical protein